MSTMVTDQAPAEQSLDQGSRWWLSRLLAEYEALQSRQTTLNETTRSLLARLSGPQPPAPDASEGMDLFSAVREYERSLLLWALARCAGQQLAAARLLGVRPSTFNEKMKRLGIRRQGAALSL